MYNACFNKPFRRPHYRQRQNHTDRDSNHNMQEIRHYTSYQPGKENCVANYSSTNSHRIIRRNKINECSLPLMEGSNVCIQFPRSNHILTSAIAHVDSGASISLMSKTQWLQLNEKQQLYAAEIPSLSEHVVNLVGGQTKMWKCFKVKCCFSENFQVYIDFFIIDASLTNIILGRDFLTMCSAELNFATNNLNIRFPSSKASKDGRNNTKVTPTEAVIESVKIPIPQKEEQKKVKQPEIDQSVVEFDKLKMDHLTKEQADKVLQVARKNQHSFVKTDGKLGHCTIHPLEIKMKENSQVVKQRQFRMSPHIMKFASEQIEFLKQEDVIELSDSEYNSALLLVKKQHQKSHEHLRKADKSKPVKYRVVIDYRSLNDQIVKDQHILPNMEEIFDQICANYLPHEKPSYFSSLDLVSGYFQIAMNEASRKYTAFTFQGEKYCFKRMPQGLSISGGHFAQVIQKVLKPYLGKFVVAYLDDILIYSPTFEKHLQHLHLVLQAFAKANLLLSVEKCQLAKTSAEFLGFKFSKHGIEPSEKHVSAIKTFPTPKSVKEVRRFLGLVNFFRKHIPDRASICQPLNNLTRKEAVFQWSTECEHSFQKLKEIFTSKPLLHFPRFDKRFYLATDASQIAIGACLMQKDDQNCYYPIAYCGRNLSKSEQNYGITRLELLAAVFAISYFRVYLEGQQFTLLTDHIALKSILNSKSKSPQMIRWAISLQNYDFSVEYVKGLLNTVPDCLSRRPYDYCKTQIDKEVLEPYPDNQMINASKRPLVIFDPIVHQREDFAEIRDDDNIEAKHLDLELRNVQKVCHKINTLSKQVHMQLYNKSIIGEIGRAHV